MVLWYGLPYHKTRINTTKIHNFGSVKFKFLSISRKEVKRMNKITIGKITVNKILISLLLVAVLFAYSSTQKVLGIEESAEKTYDDFLEAIMTFESSIDPAQADYYAENYNTPNAVHYQRVEYPGRVLRDINGNTVSVGMSIKQYFDTIGVGDIYVRGSKDPEMFKQMQYSTTNYLGFIGYQFSESDLWDLGYYTNYTDIPVPPIEMVIPKYYSDVPVSNWANGVRGRVMETSRGLTMVTDVNTWTGTFTGKHGIESMETFKSHLQDYIIKDHFVFKYNNIVKGLAAHDKTVKDYVGKTIYWNKMNPPVSHPPGNRSNAVTVTYSGMLAAAHLRGAQGVVDLLYSSKNDADENGTYALQYMQDFGGYQTPFGNSYISEEVIEQYLEDNGIYRRGEE